MTLCHGWPWTSEPLKKNLLILIFALFFQARMIDNGHAVIPVPEAINLRDFNGDPNADPIESPRQHNMWERIRKILRNRYRPAGQSLPTTATTPTGGTGNSEDRSSNPNHHQTPTTVEAWKRKEKKTNKKIEKKKIEKKKKEHEKRLFLKIVFATPTVIVFSTYVLVIQQHTPMPPCLPTPALLSRDYSWKDPPPGPPYPPQRDANSTFSVPVNCPILILYTRHWFCKSHQFLIIIVCFDYITMAMAPRGVRPPGPPVPPTQQCSSHPLASHTTTITMILLFLWRYQLYLQFFKSVKKIENGQWRHL